MVFQKELQEFLLVSPLDLVVVLDRVGLIGRCLRRRALGEQRQRGCGKQKQDQRGPHQASWATPRRAEGPRALSREVPEVTSLSFRTPWLIFFQSNRTRMVEIWASAMKSVEGLAALI